MSRRHDEASWDERVARFVRSPRRVINLDAVRRAEQPEPKPKPESTSDTEKESQP